MFGNEVSEILQRVMEEDVRVTAVEYRKGIMEGMTYVRNNFDWIEKIPKVEAYGSGPVERTVDVTLARIFRKREMNGRGIPTLL